MDATLSNIQHHMESQDLKPQVQKDTQQLYSVFKHEEREFVIFVRLYEGKDLIQLLSFFPLQVSEKRRDVVARVLHMLNKEIDLPGFGFDENAGLIFYRLMIPLFDQQFDPRTFDLLYVALPRVCQQFWPVISHAVYSNATFDQMLQKAK